MPPILTGNLAMKYPDQIYFVILSLFIMVLPMSTLAQQTDIPGPAGSGAFGTNVVVLPNGNFVVTDPTYDAPGPVPDVGAVYLYDGATLSIISTLTGGTASDQIGNASIVLLANGNFVVRSWLWDNSAATNAGAVTWCSATTGCNGAVSSSNSFVGTTINEYVGLSDAGSLAVIALANGNYVVNTATWDNPSPLVTNAGASTWCSGSTGCTGTISADNSLIGDKASDAVSDFGAVALTNGNYVVRSSRWDHEAAIDAGAITWCSGTTGCTGIVSQGNSLVGTSANDRLGNVTALPNGNYVMSDSGWDNPSTVIANVGAVTFCSGISGCTGTISSANSLIGSTAGDQVGSNFPLVALTNSNYVVGSPNWGNPSRPITSVGAATFCSGVTGCVGIVSSSNSLVGSTFDDRVGSNGVTALTNGNYVVNSSGWDNPAPATANAGAATFCDGTTGCVGAVSSSNSLTGLTAGNSVGLSTTALSTGNYVVRSSFWDNAATMTDNVGAATFCNGTAGCNGGVSTANSLVGSVANDNIGTGGIVALTNGSYVVHSGNWDNPVNLTPNVGSATWCSGAGGCIGVVSEANSLIGATPGDFANVFGNGVTALANGNYVVRSHEWDNLSPQTVDAGAVTWCSGTAGCTGVHSAATSLIGSSANDRVGNNGIAVLANGNYLVISSGWDNPVGSIPNARAVTLGNGAIGTTGHITSTLSIVGTVTNGLGGFDFDLIRNRLIAGRGASNIVSILTPNLLQTPTFTVSDSTGNNNGVSEPGENLTLMISLLNNTRTIATGTTLQVVGGGSANYGTINEGETVSRQILYMVPANTPCGSVLTIVFNANSSLGPTSFSRTMFIGAPGQLSLSQNFDGVAAPSFPTGWTPTAVQNGINFVTSAADPATAPNSAFAFDPLTVGGGTNLTSPLISVTSALATVSFRNKYNTEPAWDGGVLEVSVADGAFQDILASGGSFTQNGYNGTLGANGANNPLAGRSAWTGNSAGYVTTTAQLPASANGKLIRLRWRFGADDNTAPAGGGWSIDSISLTGAGFVESFLCSTIRSPFDFDGDNKTDIGIFRPAPAEWWINRSSNGSTFAAQFGATTDRIVPGDYTGDGKTDIAVWRPSTGSWFVLRSEDFSFFSSPFGTKGDVPVPADYDTDGKSDAAVFRPSTSTWFISRSTGGTHIETFGANGDVPVPADYDGDGKADIAIFRPSLGQWWLNRSSTGVIAVTFGNSSDKPVQGDYTGDGKADVAFWRPSSGEWYILRSEDFSYFSVPFGTTGDIPSPGDYDGDGRFDTTVFRPSSATWFIDRSTAGTLIQQFGVAGDRPVPSAFVP